jgi:hypothetical protein
MGITKINPDKKRPGFENPTGGIIHKKETPAIFVYWKRNVQLAKQIEKGNRANQ